MIRCFFLCAFVTLSSLLASMPGAVVTSFPDSTCAGALEAGDSAYRSFDNESARIHYARAFDVDSTRFDALWKLSRALTDCAAVAADDERDAFLAESERVARRCVALYPDSAQAHFTLALALGRAANESGGKRRIALSKEIKIEADTTLAINPGHFGAMHVLGRWHYGIASLSWFERSIAKIIYGGVPPGASMEQARIFFEQAIALDPMTPINHLWLGETLVKLKDYPGARTSLERCIELDDVLWDDAVTREKARERLEEIEDKK